MKTRAYVGTILLSWIMACRGFATAPNVVIIVTDDQGWGDIGYHTPEGQVHIDTPTMDSFATSGIRLEKFYATAVCSVTRSCLLTGRNTLRTGTNNTRGLDLSEHIMPQTFKAAGYQTNMCGKWHLGGSDKNLSYTTVNGNNVRIIQESLQYAPYNRGWDTHYGEYSGAIDCFTHVSQEEADPDVPDWWSNGVQLIENTDQQGHGGYSTDLLADRAVSHILNRDPAKPILLYLAFNAIHGPVQAPPSYLAKYSAIPDVSRRTIAASVDCMDVAMGRVLAALDTAGISNNTLVVWFSDNGGDETKGSINDPLRGTKGDGYDGAIHEPAGIRWPGVLPAGVVSNQYMWVGDLFPTICAATGVTAKNTKPFDGLNLWPALLAASNSTTVQRPATLVTGTALPSAFDTFTDPVNGGSKVFKVIRTRVGTNTTNQLFNMTDDPYEASDLLLGGNAAAYSNILTSLTTAITNLTAENYPPYIGPPLIKNSVVKGGSITLYAPFTSYKAPTVQWRQNGVAISGATSFTQVIDTLGDLVTGAYTTKFTLSNVTPAEAATYDVVVSNSGGSTTSESGVLTVISDGPTIASVSTGPTSPTYLDPVWITAKVNPSAGTSISQVRLTYDLGTPVSTQVFKEVFNSTSSNAWNGTGAINPWTVIASTAANARQSVGTSNHTVPIIITSCETVEGNATVACASTAGLWPGMFITGPNVPAATKINSVSNPTSFVMSANAIGSGMALALTAAGMSLTDCSTTAASTTVTCDNTVGLVSGMSLTGTGIANNATVNLIANSTTFTMNAAPTTPGTALTLIASGSAAEFQTGTANLADSMFTTTNGINTTGTSGYVEFYLQTRDLAATNNNAWTLQVSSDGGATWNTRLSEDWTGKTVNLSNCVLNSAGNSAGSPTVTCADTTGLTVGRAVAGPIVYLSGGIANGSATVACSNTAGLAAGMFLQGTGITNGTRILSIVPNTSFTMSANSSTTNASAAIAATYISSTATVSAVTNATTYTINKPAYVNTSASPIAVSASTLNHGYQLYRYDLSAAELGANTKLRFQFAGYTPTSPTSSPRVDIDDIVVATTAAASPVSLSMFDDGLHGDAAAGDGIYGAAVPMQPGGTTVNFRVDATDSNGSLTANPAVGNYSYSVNPSLTDTTIKNAEFLGMPTDTTITLNVVASLDQYAFVEYGTAPGIYTAATPITLFTADPAKPEFYNPIEITLSGLQPNTQYYYRLRHRDTDAAEFKARGERSFHTARPRKSPFVFTVTADPHLDIVTDQELFGRCMSNIRSDQPDLHIDLGDIFMTDKMADTIASIPISVGGGTPNQPRVNDRSLIVRNLFEQTCHSVPYFFTLGNHEAEYGYTFNAAADKENNIPAWDLKARKAYFPTPVPNDFYTGNATPMDYSGGSLGLLEDYYAWEWGDALFIVLDPFWNTNSNANQANDAWLWSLGKPQYDWLQRTLQNSSAGYKFVFMHHIVGGSTTLADGATRNLASRGGVEVADKYEWGGKNADGSEGFAEHRAGWDMPIHNLLVANKVNVVFHGHDHLYGYQTLDGIVYLECPQPATANYTALGSAGDGNYTTGVLLPNSGHIRVAVGPDLATAQYVRAYRAVDENAARHNQDISHSFTVSPRIYPPIEMSAKTPNQASFRWTAVPHQPYSIQWSNDLVNWQTIDTVTFSNTNTNGSYIDIDPARVNQNNAFYRVSYTP